MANNHNEPTDVVAEPDPPQTAPDALIISSVSSTVKMPEEDELAGLPRLDYKLMDHKTKLFWMSGLLIIESSIAPVVLFYGLSYGTTLREGIVFAIITSFFGIVSGLEFAHRSWRLILKEDTYRPIGMRRWHFDFTHATLGAAYTVMTALLVGASIPHPPLVRPLSMPVAIFFIHLGAQCLVMGWMAARAMPSRCRISSIPKGEPTPPLVLTLVEDVVGVDGGGGRDYRARLMARYKASRKFRSLIKGLNWFWGVGSLLFGIALMVVVWIVPEDIAYGIGWGAPLVYVIIWTFVTVVWTKRSLKAERRAWAAERSTAQAHEKPNGELPPA